MHAYRTSGMTAVFAAARKIADELLMTCDNNSLRSAYDDAASKLYADHPTHVRRMLAVADAYTMWAECHMSTLSDEMKYFGHALMILATIAGGPLSPATIDATADACKQEFARMTASRDTSV